MEKSTDNNSVIESEDLNKYNSLKLKAIKLS